MIGAIIQARMGSTRLPGKVFKPLAEKPLLWHVVNRLRPSTHLQKIIVATTTSPQNAEIARWCQQSEIDFFRGSEDNVLNRFYEAATAFNLDTVVRITADDPFKDYQVMDAVIDLFQKENLDFAYNNKPPTFPEGLDIEVFTYKALAKAEKMSTDPFEREHMTQYFFRNSSQFKQKNYSNNKDLSHLRWTIDNIDDYNMAGLIYSALGKNNHHFLTGEILAFLEEHPNVAEMNLNVTRSHMYSKNT